MTAETTPYGDVFKGLPGRIHVGHACFRVVIGPPGSSEFLEENDGCANFNEFCIYLRDNLPLQAAINTVQHEVTHCINWVYGVTDDSDEEQFTTQHTNGQLEVWLRNPRLLNWMVKQLRRMKKEPPVIKKLRAWLLARAFRRVQRAIQSDPGYAWAWQSNIAMAVVDAGSTHPDADPHELGNRAARRFLGLTFDVDVVTHPEWARFEKAWAEK